MSYNILFYVLFERPNNYNIIDVYTTINNVFIKKNFKWNTVTISIVEKNEKR